MTGGAERWFITMATGKSYQMNKKENRLDEKRNSALFSFRRSRGPREKNAAALVVVDPYSWSNWKRNEHEITASPRKRIFAILRKPLI